ncbi:MAG TPA: fatty acid desaturase [Thermoleophilaceae bacterium]|jgi:stearoyl-CoA desaturase (delta-9 desaturase)
MNTTTQTDARAQDRIPIRTKVMNLLFLIVPLLGLVAAIVLLWNDLVHTSDLVLLVVMYTLSGLGITIGFHRLLTHRAFKTSPRLRHAWAVLGSIGVEGPVIHWVADHRKHHAFADEEGDPHSPHVGHGSGLRGALKGLWHAHTGWLFTTAGKADMKRYAPDLLEDPTMRWINRHFLPIALAGIALPALIGGLVVGSLTGALTGLLWGGLARVFLMHQFTLSINSVAHSWGRRAYETTDKSRNVAWLAIPSFGEGWHNNHHAFPTSAYHGLRPWQLDISGLLITGMEKAGLAWDVVRVPPSRRSAGPPQRSTV